MRTRRLVVVELCEGGVSGGRTAPVEAPGEAVEGGETEMAARRGALAASETPPSCLVA